MKEIMNIPHVVTASLAYSYSEEGLNAAFSDLVKREGAVPEELEVKRVDPFDPQE